MGEGIKDGKVDNWGYGSTGVVGTGFGLRMIGSIAGIERQKDGEGVQKHLHNNEYGYKASKNTICPNASRILVCKFLQMDFDMPVFFSCFTVAYRLNTARLSSFLLAALSIGTPL